MKKQLLLFAILVVSLTCFACSQTPTPTAAPSTEQSVEQSVAPTLAPSEEVTPTTAPSVSPSRRPYSELFFSRPQDTNLEFWITESVKGISFSNYETTREGEFGVAWYCGTGYTKDMTEKVIYGITGYPDHSDSPAITAIEITDPQTIVYGLTINSSNEEFTSKMEFLNFTVTDKGTKLVATKGNLSIAFYQGTKIYLGVSVTNDTGIIF